MVHLGGLDKIQSLHFRGFGVEAEILHFNHLPGLLVGLHWSSEVIERIPECELSLS